MKWLVLGVLLANGVLLYWFVEQGAARLEPALVGAGSAEGDRNEIVLLSELKERPTKKRPGNIAASIDKDSELVVENKIPNDIGGIGREEVAGRPVNIVMPLNQGKGLLSDGALEPAIQEVSGNGVRISDSEIHCVRLGLFDNETRAKDLLLKINSSVNVVGHVRPVIEGLTRYLVYMPPLGSRPEAQQWQAEMNKKNIDSFIYYKGPLKNGLSLGYFASKDNAQRKRESVAVGGYEVIVKSVTVEITRYWIGLKKQELAKLSELFWEDIALLYPDVVREEIPCSLSVGINAG